MSTTVTTSIPVILGAISGKELFALQKNLLIANDESLNETAFSSDSGDHNSVVEACFIVFIALKMQQFSDKRLTMVSG